MEQWLEKIAGESFKDEFEKIAKGSKEDSTDLGWWERQKAGMRAARRTNKGIGKYIANPELVGERVTGQLKGMAIGASAGAGVGTAAGVTAAILKKMKGKKALGAIGTGAGLSALAGMLIGQPIGQYKAEKKWFDKKGITVGPLGVKTLTPKARKKYVLDYQIKK